MDSPLMRSLSKAASNSLPLLPIYSSQTEQPTQLQARPPESIPSPEISSMNDTLLALSRQTAHIQRTLQSLLDSQSHGLLAGLGHHHIQAVTYPSRTSQRLPQARHPSHEGSDDGARTPNTSTSTASGPTSISRGRNSNNIVPIRQPKPVRPLGLRASRKALLKTMLDLADAKYLESKAYNTEVAARAKILESIDEHKRRKQGLLEVIRSIEDGTAVSTGHYANEGEEAPNSRKFEELQAEEMILETQITEVENRLWELKAKHKHVSMKRVECENRIESRLSSYREALRVLDKDADERYLRRRPPGLRGLVFGRNGKTREGAWELPRKRRSVGLVKDEVQEEKAQLEKKMEEVDREVEACVLGCDMWKEVVADVEGVEMRLRDEVGKMNKPMTTTTLATRPSGNGSQEGVGKGMVSILHEMDRVVGDLDVRLSEAVNNEWNLLVCCIGAEVEALREGREMLQAALDSSLNAEYNMTDQQSSRTSLLVDVDIATVPKEPKIPSFESAASGLSKTTSHETEDEDDGPGPEFLVETMSREDD